MILTHSTIFIPCCLSLKLQKVGALPEEGGLSTTAADEDLSPVGLPVCWATVDGLGSRVGKL